MRVIAGCAGGICGFVAPRPNWEGRSRVALDIALDLGNRALPHHQPCQCADGIDVVAGFEVADDRERTVLGFAEGDLGPVE